MSPISSRSPGAASDRAREVGWGGAPMACAARSRLAGDRGARAEELHALRIQLRVQLGELLVALPMTRHEEDLMSVEALDQGPHPGARALVVAGREDVVE